ncbi:hypothetical protein AB0L68_25230 [Streptomyces sp. NPDC052164]|uniref:hypothetical protein n=1 Tax=Streptomyces sp. NPDC052164 TaxID=3155529 RepID=UPI003444DE07
MADHPGLPASIDFDTAAPGNPLGDLGYMSWTWCISSKPQAPSPTHGHRHSHRSGFWPTPYGLDTRNALWWHHHRTAPDRREAGSEQILARIAWSRREHEHTAANRVVLANAPR